MSDDAPFAGRLASAAAIVRWRLAPTPGPGCPGGRLTSRLSQPPGSADRLPAAS